MNLAKLQSYSGQNYCTKIRKFETITWFASLKIEKLHEDSTTGDLLSNL